MHALYRKADELSREVIGSAIEVHRIKGPGLIESIYEKCLMRELNLRGISAANQQVVKIEYKGETLTATIDCTTVSASHPCIAEEKQTLGLGGDSGGPAGEKAGALEFCELKIKG